MKMTRSFWSRTLDKGLLLLTIVAVAVLTAGTVPETAGAEELVTVCHKPGTPDQKTLQVEKRDLLDHLAHGDQVGACEAAPELSAACQAINGPENTGTKLHVNGEFLIDTLSYQQADEDWFAEGETVDAAVLANASELPEESATEQRFLTLYYTDLLIQHNATATGPNTWTFTVTLTGGDILDGEQHFHAELRYLQSNITSNEVTVTVRCSAQ
jgi:hypothetical protein